MIMTLISLLHYMLALGVFVDSGMMRRTPTSGEVPWMVRHTANANGNAMDSSNDTLHRSRKHMHNHRMVSQVVDDMTMVSKEDEYALHNYDYDFDGDGDDGKSHPIKRTRTRTRARNVINGVRKKIQKLTFNVRRLHKIAVRDVYDVCNYCALSEVATRTRSGSKDVPSVCSTTPKLCDAISSTTTSPFTTDERIKMVQVGDALLRRCEEALESSEIWDVVVDEAQATSAGHYVKIWRTFVPFDRDVNSPGDAVTNEPTVRSEVVLDASPSEVFSLFRDNRRVHEYNPNCAELHDLIEVDENVKINWCATAKFGPMKARDFVTMVHYRYDHNGGYASIATKFDHHLLPPTEGYVRSQVQVNAIFMHPVANEPNKTRFIQVTRIGELGGLTDSAFVRKISQRIQERTPIDFCRKFNEVLKRSTLSSGLESNLQRRSHPFPSLNHGRNDGYNSSHT